MFKFRLFKSEPEEMKASEAGMILLGKFEREKHDTENKLVSAVKDIAMQMKEIEAIVIVLRGKTTPETYANTIKNKFCAKSVEALAGLPDYNDTYDSLKGFVTKSDEIMHVIGGLDMKEFRHLHAFNDDMAQIAERIRMLENELNFAKKILADSVMNKIDKINAMIASLGDFEAKAKMANDNTAETKEFIDSLKGMIKTSETQVERLNGTLSEYAGDRIRLRDLDKTAESLRLKIDAEFSGLDRVFKKYLYFGDLSKADSLLLNNYIKSPGQAFLDDRGNEIRDILESLHRFRSREMIEMDDGKFNRIEELIRRFPSLVELRAQHDEINSKKSDLEKEFAERQAPVANETKAALAEIENRKKELAALEMRIRSYETEKRVALKEMEDAKNKLELSISELLNRNVRIV
jgi:chromosome segregation ATPase